MKRTNITLSDFEAICALVDGGSFRVASESLGLSPSALSRQISTLEGRLGTRLFDRDTRNIELTTSGKAFARIAERMVFTAADVMSEFDAHLSARNGRLTIAGLPSVTSALLPGLLSSFSEVHEDVDLRILDALSNGVLEAVESGVADIGFTAGTISARSRLSFLPLLDDKFIAIGKKGGPLSQTRPYLLTELAEFPFIAMARGTSVRELTDSAFQTTAKSVSPRFEVAHLATAGALVSEGLGIAVLPTLTLPILRVDQLDCREISDFGTVRRIGIVHRSGRSLSPTASAFLAHVNANLGFLRDEK